MIIGKDVVTMMINFLLNYAKVHGLPSLVGKVNKVTILIIFLPAEKSYKPIHCDFLVVLKEDKTLCALTYDVFCKLWYQLTWQIQIISLKTDLYDTCQQLQN